MFGIFPKVFIPSTVGNFPAVQCLSSTCPSPPSVLAIALGPLAHPIRSARPPVCCRLLENAFGKKPNTFLWVLLYPDSTICLKLKLLNLTNLSYLQST